MAQGAQQKPEEKAESSTEPESTENEKSSENLPAVQSLPIAQSIEPETAAKSEVQIADSQKPLTRDEQLIKSQKMVPITMRSPFLPYESVPRDVIQVYFVWANIISFRTTHSVYPACGRNPCKMVCRLKISQ